MMGFKDFRGARIIPSGVEAMHMVRKEQMKDSDEIPLSAAQQFHSLIS